MKVDFTAPLTTLKGKSHEIMRTMTQDEDITDDMVTRFIDTKGNIEVRVEVVVSTLADIAANCLLATKYNETAKKKKKFKRAQLAEQIIIAEIPVEITVSQAQDIIKAVDMSGGPLELMRICEAVDPDGELMGDED